jgi:tetratricopeptide (TPR) repeat protein
MLLGILNDDPKNGPTRQRLGAVTFLSGKPEEAFAEFKQAVQDDPALEPAELRIALLSSNRGDRTKAEEWLKKAVTAFPQDARTHRAYAVFLLDDNKPDAASLYIDGAKKLAPQVRETLAIRAMYHRHKREYTAAIELFEQLYKDGPSDAFAIGNLAIVLAETNDEKNRKRAIDLAESLVKLNPRSSESYAVLGWCQFKQGKLDDAEKSLTSAAGAGQISFDTAYYIAKVFNERGKFREARDFLAQVVEATGAFVYRPDARVLLAELQKKVPADPPPEKK